MRWTYKPEPDADRTALLADALQVDPLVAGLLVQRGICTFEEARTFFRPELEHLHDPFLMQDMHRAVTRIEEAIERGERILIYGDYDVDGTSAVALLIAYLREFYTDVASYIPDRYTEGYGVSLQGIDFASDNEMTLIIALDCGVKAIEQVAYAKDQGIDFIICDHHRPGPQLPDAIAVLDPKREDCPYPYKELCGCGVGFKLIQALHTRRGLDVESLMPYLDLVAVAIAADIVPITGENRVLSHFGLRVINDNPRPGLKAIMGSIRRDSYKVSDLVFQVAPRLNAAGRMEHGQMAVRLLTERDARLAQEQATVIESLNEERRGMDRQITEEALELIREHREENRMSTVVYKQDWHKGVIGIVASRLTETYYRPTLVFTKSGDRLAASARSVRGFDVYEALQACADCIEQFGGHTYAAGLTLHESRFEEFKSRFEKVVSNSIQPEQLQPELQIDLRVHLHQITTRLVRILEQFAPFGPGNPSPVFEAGPLRDTGHARRVGEAGDHLKLAVVQEGAGPLGGIGFGLGEKLSMIQGGAPFHAVFSAEQNNWQGQSGVQLKVRDLEAEAPDQESFSKYSRERKAPSKTP
ncbi:MAG: single-stranded-DNA-specific exonuclease RecJ [Flavobacteriaceae bacterium]|nr:MAG: single-stranded-DNA-specific exonuclease RecJ [Flavobacteriaceae bacterium]